MSDNLSELIKKFTLLGCQVVSEDKSKGLVELKGLTFLSIVEFGVKLLYCPLSRVLYKVILTSPELSYEDGEKQADKIATIYGEKFQSVGEGQSIHYLGFRDDDFGIDDSYEGVSENYYYKANEEWLISIESEYWNDTKKEGNQIESADVGVNVITYSKDSLEAIYEKEVRRYDIEAGLQEI